MPGGFSHQQQDAFLLWFENNRLNKETETRNDMPKDDRNHNSQQYKEAFEQYNTASNELRKKYRVEDGITKEGDIITKNPPIPNNPKEAFELFKNYYGAKQFEVNKLHFCQKYLAWNEAAIKAEIKIIEDWIKKGEQINYSDCTINSFGNIENSHSQEHEYLRFKNGFYDGYLMTWEQHQETSNASTVYGRYFLFYEYLKELVKGEICMVPSIIEITNNNFNICDEILWSYYRMVQQPTERPENYVGPLWKHNTPYQVNVCGAYLLMSEWKILEMHMTNVDDKSGYYKDYKWEKVFESLKNYAKGFQFGFNNFFIDIAKEKLTSELSRDEKVFAVIDYLTNPLNKPGFSKTHGGSNVFSGWYDDGVNGGKYYCAWYFIMANHRLFEPHFKEKNKLPNKDENGDFIEDTDKKAADQSPSNNLLAVEMKKNRKKQAEKNQEAENKKKKDFENLVDNDNYSPTLEDFKEGALIEKKNCDTNEYLKHLRAEKLRYANYSKYCLHYDDSNKYEILKSIVEFISEEITNDLKIEAKPTAVDENSEPDLITKHLYCLSGKWRNTKIMSADEYKRLIEYAKYTIENNGLPQSIKSIELGNSNLNELFYRKTIHILWKNLKTKTTHSQALWIDFYKKVFKSLTKNITHDFSRSFAKYNKDYEADKNSITFDS